jgi:hypothetical protein
MLMTWGMSGLVTERDFAEAEVAFPGIEGFYRTLNSKPPTFLDLLRLFLDAAGDDSRWHSRHVRPIS